MTEHFSYNPDRSGTHPNSHPVPPRPVKTMAEAIAAFSTAVRILPDGTSELINPQPLEVQEYREEREEDALSAKYAAIAAARAIMPEKPFSINDIGKTGFESAHPPSTQFLDDKLGK